jgi:signal transduction histidine kinase
MRDRPGSGLGLAIVAQVAESHGGTIAAANAVPGPGAVFTLRIPG